MIAKLVISHDAAANAEAPRTTHRVPSCGFAMASVHRQQFEEP